MKIVNRQIFLALPAGTIYSKYKPCIFDEMGMKGESLFYDDPGDGYCHDDFYYAPIGSQIDCSGSEEYFDRLNEMVKAGVSYPVDMETIGRDGFYEKEQLFAIWEKDDLLSLAKVIEQAIANYPQGDE